MTDFRAQQLDLSVYYTPYIQKSKQCILMAVHTGRPPRFWTVQEGLSNQTTQMPIDSLPIWLSHEATEHSLLPSETNIVPGSVE